MNWAAWNFSALRGSNMTEHRCMCRSSMAHRLLHSNFMHTRLVKICSWLSPGRFMIRATWAVLLGAMWWTAVVTAGTAGADASDQPPQHESVAASSGNPSPWQWVPTQEEIRNYRNSWNPLSNGPILLSAVD